MDVYLCTMCTLPAEARRRWLTWNWICRLLWAAICELGHLEKQPVFLPAESYPVPDTLKMLAMIVPFSSFFFFLPFLLPFLPFILPSLQSYFLSSIFLKISHFSVCNVTSFSFSLNYMQESNWIPHLPLMKFFLWKSTFREFNSFPSSWSQRKSTKGGLRLHIKKNNENSCQYVIVKLMKLRL